MYVVIYKRAGIQMNWIPDSLWPTWSAQRAFDRKKFLMELPLGLKVEVHLIP